MPRTKNLVEAITRKLDDDADLAQLVENERFNINVSGEIFRVRTELGMTQKELAALAGTKQSVIARLEDAEYEGHSLRLLRRIAEATSTRLTVQFVGANSDSRRPKKDSPAKVRERARKSNTRLRQSRKR